MTGKGKKNQYFTKRGVKTVTIDHDNETLDVIIKVPTNREHNELMERFADISATGETNIHMAEFAEEQLVQFIVDLPFNIPVNPEMTEFKSWKEASEIEKRVAINCMDTNLHDSISKTIIGASNLSVVDKGN